MSGYRWTVGPTPVPSGTWLEPDLSTGTLVPYTDWRRRVGVAGVDLAAGQVVESSDDSGLILPVQP